MGRSKRKQKRGPQTQEGLIQHALLRLAAGDAKQSLASLRRAQFKGVPSEHLNPLFHRAYLLRARELEARGMKAEAEAARENAAEHGSDKSAHEPTAADIVPFLLTLPSDSRLAAYARYLRSNPPSPDAEVMLADHLVLNRCWEQLDALPEACRFRDDAKVMAAASEPLDLGNWEDGSQILKELPAESGFRHWSGFCSAMAAHVREDLPAVAKTLKGLPPDFPLRSATKALRANSRPGAAEIKSARSDLERQLGIGRSSVAKRAEAVRRAVNGSSTDRIGRTIRGFAKAVDPCSPDVTALRLIRALYLAFEAGQLDDDDYWDAFDKVVPERQRDSVELLLYCQSLAKKPGALDYLTDIAETFDSFKQAFPDESDRQIARAKILGRLAELIQSSSDWRLSYADAENVCLILGDFEFQAVEKYAKSARLAAIDLTRMSIDADPSNVEAHKQLVAMLESDWLLRTSELISAYENYAEAVPEDPEPWIALAELRLGSNAYRKAEAALEKARSYSSQDDRVIDLMTATSLLATKRNLRGGRLPLALRDLSKAEAVASPRSEAIVVAWKVIAASAQGSESRLAAYERLLDGASAARRAKAACFVANATLSQEGYARPPANDRQGLWYVFREATLDTCKTTPAELADLVEPLPTAFRSVAATNTVSQNLCDLWDDVLRAVPDRDALRIFPAAIEVGAVQELRRELARRLVRTQDITYKRILLLYSATLKHLQGEEREAIHFRKLIDSIPQNEISPVRTAAEKLVAPVAMQFSPVLAMALKTFNFDLLEGQQGLF